MKRLDNIGLSDIGRPYSQLPHLLQGQHELGDAVSAAELGQQLVRVHALAVSSLHQLGDYSFHFLFLGHGAEQLVVEDLSKIQQKRNKTDTVMNDDDDRSREGRVCFG